jgi:hypothetical protein
LRGGPPRPPVEGYERHPMATKACNVGARHASPGGESDVLRSWARAVLPHHLSVGAGKDAARYEGDDHMRWCAVVPQSSVAIALGDRPAPPTASVAPPPRRPRGATGRQDAGGTHAGRQDAGGTPGEPLWRLGPGAPWRAPTDPSVVKGLRSIPLRSLCALWFLFCRRALRGEAHIPHLVWRVFASFADPDKPRPFLTWRAFHSIGLQLREAATGRGDFRLTRLESTPEQTRYQVLGSPRSEAYGCHEAGYCQELPNSQTCRIGVRNVG